MTDPRLLGLIKAKVESLHDLDDEDINLLVRLAEEAQAKNERYKKLLGRLEWAGRDGLWPSCPACNGHQRDGHVGIGPERTPCWLEAELKTAPPPPPRPADADPAGPAAPDASA